MFSGWFAGFGGGIPNFPYTIGEEFAEVQALTGVTWTLKSGAATEGNVPVVIFVIAIGGDAAASTASACGRNALSSAKRLKLPGFLKVLDATEHKDSIYIATEQCTPLSTALDSRAEYYEDDDDKFAEGVALGLHSVAKALDSLHRNNLSHNNVNIDSVFVLPSGEWRIFGLDLVTNFDDEHSLYKRSRTSCIADHRIPAGRGNDAVHSVDAWGLGCLIFEVFRPASKSLRSIAPGDLRTPPAGMPRRLQPTLSGLFAAEPKMRWNMQKFITDCALLSESTYVNDLQTLAELSLRDAVERDAFLRQLSGHVDHYPLPACKLLVLPQLSSAVQFGACSATVLEPLLRLGARLTPSDFAVHVSPSVVALFSSPDQLIRNRLLNTAEEYAGLLPSQLVCDTIWPQYATGFTHKSPEIRELSVRALVHFAPHLNERLLGASGDVVRFVTQLQQDREGPIRTNSTICLGLIAKFIPVADRSKVLLNGFGRMLKDPFVPSRVAAARSLSSCIEHFTEDQMARQIVPVLAPMALDTDEDVRRISIKCVKNMMHKVEAFAATMASASPAVDAGPPPVASTPPVAAATPTAATSTGDQQKPSGWFGWGGAKPVTSSPAAAAAPVVDTSRDTTSAALEDSTASVPSVPTARSAAKALHEDPAPHETSSFSSAGGPSPTASANWLDEVSTGSSRGATTSAASATAAPAGASSAARGMTLRKKGLGGATVVKKAD